MQKGYYVSPRILNPAPQVKIPILGSVGQSIFDQGTRSFRNPGKALPAFREDAEVRAASMAWRRLAARWSRVAAETGRASRIPREMVVAMDFSCSIYPIRKAAASAIKLEHDPGRGLGPPEGQGAQAYRVGAKVEVALDVIGAGDAAAHDQRQVNFLP
jgi:hypothetical protein